MKWIEPFSTMRVRGWLGRHLLLWGVTFSVFFLTHFTAIPTLVKTIQIGLLLLPYRMVLIYMALYWVLPPVLIQNNRLFTSRLVIYLIAGVLLGFFWVAYVMLPYDTGRIVWFPEFEKIAKISLWINALMMVGVVVGIKLYQIRHRREQANQQLIRETLTISLQVLKAQIHPHFLFNTLNNLYSLTLKQSPSAPDMVLKLSGLLHYMIHECAASVVPLTQEIQFLRNYIELEKMRYGPRLHVHSAIGGNIDTQQIEPLLLIPFVENAFKHGSAKQIGDTRIEFILTVADNYLAFRVDNSIDQLPPTQSDKASGIGLTNVRKRLALLYPKAHSLIIRPELGRFSVELSLHLKPETKLLPAI